MSEKKEVTLPKIMIDNSRFEFGLGLKILKAKWKTCEAFEKAGYISKEALKLIKSEWDDAPNVTVLEALSIPNMEARRVCFRYVGIDTIFKELDPQLVDNQVIKKATKVNEKGELESFEDTYQLYKVMGQKLREGTTDTMRQIADFYILRCYCTSTGREYLIYIRDIWNRQLRWGASNEAGVGEKPDAIEAVAWTIQVEVPEDQIEKIVRQGDCIMVKPKDGYKKCALRHISKKEYLEKVVAES